MARRLSSEMIAPGLRTAGLFSQCHPLQRPPRHALGSSPPGREQGRLQRETLPRKKEHCPQKCPLHNRRQPEKEGSSGHVPKPEISKWCITYMHHPQAINS